MTVTLSVGFSNFGSWAGGDWRGFVELAKVAEDEGVNRIVVVDHVVMGRNTDAYAWGRFPVPPAAPWLEPLTVLSAMTAVTSRIRLSTGILIAPLRPAALLAKQIATLDVLSQGRVDLGVGVGWQKEEYEAQGLAFADRGRLLEETIAACRALWSDLPAAYSSDSVSFGDTFCSPQPVQPRLPVWFSGTMTDRVAARIATMGDGWIPIMGATIDDVRAGAERLRTEVDRPLTIQARATTGMVDNKPDIDATMASVPEWVGAGANDITVNLASFAPAFADAPDALKRLAAAFRDVTA